MANTSLTLGEHWEKFIRSEVGSGRYGSASEVVRDALRVLERQKLQLETLRAHLAEGSSQARNGVFEEDYSIDRLIEELDAEG
ncbi:type II toxin-antitoxin system ParD family antitoxin [Altererythrobacter xixiisoli]|uniref:Type II toxin-antitoxin system ParD family antitoxin n=1 Tax=Croceibacterium xixiisoli TaxID=1476466 RepID=A0A6I4TYX8_9SPHN|nr:type II toxin-antitoxin system ParD family antitoxin [Croceibacterium xixiisoli]MXO99838.1 type II toxin-antitoxin system ParD family antitoxin [Croceibacterium xixiisoli]